MNQNKPKIGWDIYIDEEYKDLYPYHDTNPEEEGGCGVILECEEYQDLFAALKDTGIDPGHVGGWQYTEFIEEDDAWCLTSPPSPVYDIKDARRIYLGEEWWVWPLQERVTRGA